MKELQYRIDVMIAYRDGKRVECRLADRIRHSDPWEAPRNDQHLDFDWRMFDYRIAPEPRKAREWRIPVLRGQPYLYQQPMPQEGEFVTVREVLPE